MLKVENVTKLYGKNLANDNVSFDLHDNQITVLLGQNGAGKSTIIKCIVGFLKYDGTITLDNQPVSNLDVKRQLAYIPEMPELYNELTVYQHFQFIANAYEVTDFEEAAARYLDLFELTAKKDELCGSLSKGMRQKVSVICALILNPRVLILDEPLIGLDPQAIRHLKELLKELKVNCSILISTHLIDSVTSLWDQVLIMNKGKVVFQATQASFAQQQASLEDIYFQYNEQQTNSIGGE